MIDLRRYEGHAEGPWELGQDDLIALAEAPPAEQVSDSEILDWLEQKGVHHDKFVSGRHLLTFNGKQYSGDTLRAAAVAAMTKDQP